MPRLLTHIKLKCVECEKEWSHTQSELQTMSEIEPTARNIIAILPELSCPDCSEPRLFLYDDSDEMLIDPNNITLCSYGDCDNPIPLPRFVTLGDTNVCGIDHNEIIQPTTAPSINIPEIAETEDEALMRRLISLRNQLARRRGVPRFHIFSKRTLRQIVSQRPTTEEQFLRIYGIGPERVRLYAGHLMDIMRDFEDLNLNEQGSLEEGLSNQEVAERLSELTLQLAQLKQQQAPLEDQIKECRRVLGQEQLSETERFDTQDGSRVSVFPQPAYFTSTAQKEITENQQETIPAEVFSELVSKGYIKEERSLRADEEKINQLPEEQKSDLFDQGIVSSEIKHKAARPPRDSIDDSFIQEMVDKGIFETQPNLVRYLP